MITEQREALIAFVANFVVILRNEGCSRGLAETAMSAAIASLLGAVWHLSPTGPVADEITDFTQALQSATIKRFYGGGA